MSSLSRFGSLLCAAGTVWAAGRPAPEAAASAALAQLPLRFEANQGQASPRARYIARSGGYTLEFTPGGPVLHAGSKPLALTLLKSNPDPTIEGLDRLPTRTDYFRGTRDKWRTDVPAFARVRYHEVYPGIDAVYYGNQNRLEYDFVLQPGADPRAIRLRLRGPGRLSITADGDLLLESASGRMVQKKPVIYQEQAGTSARREIAGNYVLLGRNTVGVRVAGYDRTRALVIDPVLLYSSYMGGPGSDRINAVKMGPNHRLYIIGQTDTTPFTASNGAYQANPAGVVDGFLAIIDTTAGAGYPLVYFSYIGGGNSDAPLALDVDRNGVAYLTGYTNSTDFPVTAAVPQSTGATTTQDAFVVKLDPSQVGGDALIFSTYLGGTSGTDTGTGIAVDASGMIYVIGDTRSSDFPVTDTAFLNFLWGAQNAFVVKMDPTAGTLVYASYVGGGDIDSGRAILAGSNGIVYLGITTTSQTFPVKGLNWAADPRGGQDIAIAIMDTTKSGEDSFVYSSYFGGSDNDDVRAMAFDAKGNLLLTGYTLSTDFPTTPDSMQNVNNGANDAFVSVFNPSVPGQGALIYSTYLGGKHGDTGYAIQSDSAGNIYVAGYTMSSDFPVVNAPQPNWGFGQDVFVTKLTPGIAGPGAMVYSTYYGATSLNLATGIAVDSDGNAYVGGFAGRSWRTTDNSLQAAFAGGLTDGFLLILSPQ